MRSVATATVRNVQSVQISLAAPSFEHFEQIEQGKRSISSIVKLTETSGTEQVSGARREWCQAVARMDRHKPPGDVPLLRWLRFIADCRGFLDDEWTNRAVALGWGALDLFGCNQVRPFGRVEHLGLIWLLNGGRIMELHRDRAEIQTQNGRTQTFRRRPVEVRLVVPAWELRE
jgi:hypothetical protein